MIRLMAPRCAHRRNPPTFRVLLCRATPTDTGAWCGRRWTATSPQQLDEHRAERAAHEALCCGPGLAGQLRTALAERTRLT